jgi:hypothetical protein
LATSGDEKFFESTRMRMVSLLRRSGAPSRSLPGRWILRTTASASISPSSSAMALCGSEGLEVARYPKIVALASGFPARC